jgi:hypothetical protein
MVIKLPEDRKPLRRNKLRRYAQDTVELKRILKRIQDELVIDTEARLYQRYRAQTRNLELRPTYEDWLVSNWRLDGTFSSSAYSYETRQYWASRTVGEARKYTLGSDYIDWFLRGLEAQFTMHDAHVVVQSVSHGVNDYTLTFSRR